MPARSSELVERIPQAYVAGALPVKTIAILFGIGAAELGELVRQHGWAARSETLWAPSTTSRERAAAVRAAEAAHEAALYPDCVDDVRILRRRRFTITREHDKVLVGNALCTFEQMRSRADRERRLMAAAMMD